LTEKIHNEAHAGSDDAAIIHIGFSIDNVEQNDRISSEQALKDFAKYVESAGLSLDVEALQDVDGWQRVCIDAGNEILKHLEAAQVAKVAGEQDDGSE